MFFCNFLGGLFFKAIFGRLPDHFFVILESFWGPWGHFRDLVRDGSSVGFNGECCFNGELFLLIIDVRSTAADLERVYRLVGQGTCPFAIFDT